MSYKFNTRLNPKVAIIIRDDEQDPIPSSRSFNPSLTYSPYSYNDLSIRDTPSGINLVNKRSCFENYVLRSIPSAGSTVSDFLESTSSSRPESRYFKGSPPGVMDDIYNSLSKEYNFVKDENKVAPFVIDLAKLKNNKYYDLYYNTKFELSKNDILSLRQKNTDSRIQTPTTALGGSPQSKTISRRPISTANTFQSPKSLNITNVSTIGMKPIQVKKPKPKVKEIKNFDMVVFDKTFDLSDFKNSRRVVQTMRNSNNTTTRIYKYETNKPRLLPLKRFTLDDIMYENADIPSIFQQISSCKFPGKKAPPFSLLNSKFAMMHPDYYKLEDNEENARWWATKTPSMETLGINTNRDYHIPNAREGEMGVFNKDRLFSYTKRFEDKRNKGAMDILKRRQHGGKTSDDDEQADEDFYEYLGNNAKIHINERKVRRVRNLSIEDIMKMKRPKNGTAIYQKFQDLWSKNILYIQNTLDFYSSRRHPTKKKFKKPDAKEAEHLYQNLVDNKDDFYNQNIYEHLKNNSLDDNSLNKALYQYSFQNETDQKKNSKQAHVQKQTPSKLKQCTSETALVGKPKTKQLPSSMFSLRDIPNLQFHKVIQNQINQPLISEKSDAKSKTNTQSSKVSSQASKNTMRDFKPLSTFDSSAKSQSKGHSTAKSSIPTTLLATMRKNNEKPKAQPHTHHKSTQSGVCKTNPASPKKNLQIFWTNKKKKNLEKFKIKPQKKEIDIQKREVLNHLKEMEEIVQECKKLTQEKENDESKEENIKNKTRIFKNRSLKTFDNQINKKISKEDKYFKYYQKQLQNQNYNIDKINSNNNIVKELSPTRKNSPRKIQQKSTREQQKEDLLEKKFLTKEGRAQADRVVSQHFYLEKKQKKYKRFGSKIMV